MNIEEIIKENRPNISQSSLKVYTQNLKNLHKIIMKNDTIQSLDFLTDFDNIIKSLEEKNKNTMKNYLVAVVILLQSDSKKYNDLIQKYQEKIKKLQDSINDTYDDNEKSNKQNKNWVDYSEILKLLRKMKKDTKPLLEKPIDELTNKEKDLIQQYLVHYLYSGKAFPIVRNDFAEMKIVNEDDKLDDDKNYFVIRKNGLPYFQLNQFKTAKYKGEQKIIIKDLELRKLINKWAKINNTGFLLINITTNTPMTANGISKYLNKIYKKHFDKVISTSLLRSIYITNKYNDNLSQKQKKELAEDMQHSKDIAEKVYNKID